MATCSHRGIIPTPIIPGNCESMLITRAMFFRTDGVLSMSNSNIFSIRDSFVIETLTGHSAPIVLSNSTTAFMHRVCFSTCLGTSGQSYILISPDDGGGTGNIQQVSAFKCSPGTGTPAAMLIRRGIITMHEINTSSCLNTGTGGSISLQPYEGTMKRFITSNCTGSSGISLGQSVSLGKMISAELSHSACVNGGYTSYEIRIVSLAATFKNFVSVQGRDTRIQHVTGSFSFENCQFDAQVLVMGEVYQSDSIITNDPGIIVLFDEIPCAITDKIMPSARSQFAIVACLVLFCE